MNVSADKLALLDSKYAGYLEGPLVDDLFRDFGVNFSAGHWAAGEFFDRFCPVGYNSDNPNFDNGIVAQIDRVARAGIAGIEFHEVVFLNPDGSVNQKTIDDVKAALKRTGLIATNMNFNVWTNPKFKYGSISHPDAGVRKAALEQIHKGVELGKELGCGSCNLWPGSDGWDYHFEVDYGKRLRWYIDGNI